jgi:hypothetical protein
MNMINNIHLLHTLKSKKVFDLMAELDLVEFEGLTNLPVSQDFLVSLKGVCQALSTCISSYVSYAYKDRRNTESLPDLEPIIVNSRLLYSYLLRLYGKTSTTASMDKIQIAHADNYLQAYIDERIESEKIIQDLESRINTLSKDLVKTREDLNRCKLYSEKVQSELLTQVSELQGEILFSFFGYTIHAH